MAVRVPVRPATRGVRVVSRASANVIAGTVAVSGRARVKSAPPKSTKNNDTFLYVILPREQGYPWGEPAVLGVWHRDTGTLLPRRRPFGTGGTC